jgi:hypothetical protein
VAKATAHWRSWWGDFLLPNFATQNLSIYVVFNLWWKIENAAGENFHAAVGNSALGEVTAVWCRGRIVLGDRLNLLEVAAFSQTSPEVMLDLSRVNLVDAAGLGCSR